MDSRFFFRAILIAILLALPCSGGIWLVGQRGESEWKLFPQAFTGNVGEIDGRD